MNQDKRSLKKKILRICGVVLRIVFIAFGLQLFANPVFGGALEKINSFSFVFMGAIFMVYGLTGRSSLRKKPSTENSPPNA